MAAWNGHDEDWDAPVPTVIRSTWDYIHEPVAFQAWVDRVGATAPLWNPPAVIRENMHKRYLVNLAAAGIATTPTVLVEQGAPTDLAGVCAAQGWGDVIVKPAIGASSYGTRRIDVDNRTEGQRHLDDLLGRTDVLIQPYLTSVDGYGERSLAWIDGAFTHAVRKTPRFSDGEEHVSDVVDIAPDEHELATRVLEPIADGLLYGRVDMARDDAGAPVLMELELIEPSLYLLQHPPGTERLVAGIVRRLEDLAQSRPE